MIVHITQNKFAQNFLNSHCLAKKFCGMIAIEVMIFESQTTICYEEII